MPRGFRVVRMTYELQMQMRSVNPEWIFTLDTSLKRAKNVLSNDITSKYTNLICLQEIWLDFALSYTVQTLFDFYGSCTVVIFSLFFDWMTPSHEY